MMVIMIIAVTLNHENIVKHAQGISKIEPFRDNCNWKATSFPSHKKDYKKL